jgi:hypothetical protein
MADPDFRTLCTELLSELEDRFTISEPADDPLIQRARAALAQPAPRPGDAIARIEKYIAERKAIRGLDPESIHTLHVGDDCREARLTISDLEALLSQPAPEPAGGRIMADPTPNCPPLWQVMRHASQHSRINWEHMDTFKYAAEIRAIAEAIQVQFNKHFADGDAVLLEVIDWLDAEADRAEAGE